MVPKGIRDLLCMTLLVIGRCRTGHFDHHHACYATPWQTVPPSRPGRVLFLILSAIHVAPCITTPIPIPLLSPMWCDLIYTKVWLSIFGFSSAGNCFLVCNVILFLDDLPRNLVHTIVFLRFRGCRLITLLALPCLG